MRQAVRISEQRNGPHHYKTMAYMVNLARFELIGGFSCSRQALSRRCFKDADLTLSKLIDTHEWVYKKINQNQSLNLLPDLVLHRDILKDYSLKLWANILGGEFEKAEQSLDKVKQLGALVLTSEDQHKLSLLSFYESLLAINRYLKSHTSA